MKYLWFILCFSVGCSAWSVQKARIVEPEIEVYQAADFDSEILEVVREGENYLVSNKSYGPFYRIKLKDGRIGYIVDYALDIEGRGRVQARDFDQLELAEAKKKQSSESRARQQEIDDDEESFFGDTYQGPFVQLLNYHEKSFGGEQIANLYTVGYKSVNQLAWSAMATLGAPAFYAEKTGGSASGFQLWGDIGISNTIANIQRNEIRLGVTLFAHLAAIKVNTPARSYDLHDVTAGLALEGSFFVKFDRHALDFSVKYFFDRASYAGFGLGVLF